MSLLKKISLLVLASLLVACSLVNTAEISTAYLTRTPQGNDRATVFGPEDTIYAIAELRHAPDDTLVKAVWILLEADGESRNETLSESEIRMASGTMTFSFVGEQVWPFGRYQLELYVDDERVRTLAFEVRGPFRFGAKLPETESTR